MPRGNIENITRFHLDHSAIVHGSSRSPGENDTHMLHITTLFPDGPANVLLPLQPGEYVARPMVIHAMWTSSNLPFSNWRSSSGCSNLLSITSSMSSSLKP